MGSSFATCPTQLFLCTISAAPVDHLDKPMSFVWITDATKVTALIGFSSKSKFLKNIIWCQCGRTNFQSKNNTRPAPPNPVQVSKKMCLYLFQLAGCRLVWRCYHCHKTELFLENRFSCLAPTIRVVLPRWLTRSPAMSRQSGSYCIQTTMVQILIESEWINLSLHLSKFFWKFCHFKKKFILIFLLERTIYFGQY